MSASASTREIDLGGRRLRAGIVGAVATTIIVVSVVVFYRPATAPTVTAPDAAPIVIERHGTGGSNGTRFPQ